MEKNFFEIALNAESKPKQIKQVKEQNLKFETERQEKL